MAMSNSLRTCDLCENACYVDLLDGRSVLVSWHGHGRASSRGAGDRQLRQLRLYIGEEVADDDE